MFIDPTPAEIKGPIRPRPVTHPPSAPVPSAPAPTWLRDFALSPRAAPTPPKRKRVSARDLMKCFAVEDTLRRTYLRIGLFFTLSLLVTWLPGTIMWGWRLGHPQSESPFGFHLAVATIFPLQGVWIAGLFFIINWKEVRVLLEDLPERAHSSSTIRGLLEEPVWRARRKSTSTGGTDLAAIKRELKWSSLWQANSPTQSDGGWDFVDIGIPSRANTVVRPARAHSDPGLTPLLPFRPSFI
jgi:hypothetical protein